MLMDVIFRVRPEKTVSHDDIKERLLALDRKPKFKIRILTQKGEQEDLAEIFFEEELKEIGRKLEKLKQQNVELLDQVEKSLHEELIKSYQNQFDALENGFFLRFEDSEIILIKKDLKITEENEYEIIHEIKVYVAGMFSRLLGNEYVETGFSVRR